MACLESDFESLANRSSLWDLSRSSEKTAAPLAIPSRMLSLRKFYGLPGSDPFPDSSHERLALAPPSSPPVWVLLSPFNVTESNSILVRCFLPFQSFQHRMLFKTFKPFSIVQGLP